MNATTSSRINKSNPSRRMLNRRNSNRSLNRPNTFSNETNDPDSPLVIGNLSYLYKHRHNLANYSTKFLYFIVFFSEILPNPSKKNTLFVKFDRIFYCLLFLFQQTDLLCWTIPPMRRLFLTMGNCEFKLSIIITLILLKLLRLIVIIANVPFLIEILALIYKFKVSAILKERISNII